MLHIDCPGCGMQRSFVLMLQGNWRSSLAMHPAMIPMLALILFTPLHLMLKLKYGAKIIVGLQIAVASITFVFYIYKILTHKIYH